MLCPLQTAVSLLSGLVAGVCAAIVSAIDTSQSPHSTLMLHSSMTLIFIPLQDLIEAHYSHCIVMCALQAAVSLLSGLVAGVCAAIVSQPADTVLTTINRRGGKATVVGTTLSLVRQCTRFNCSS